MPHHNVLIPITIIRTFFIFCTDKAVVFILIQIHIAVIAFTFFIIYIICTVITACCTQNNSSNRFILHQIVFRPILFIPKSSMEPVHSATMPPEDSFHAEYPYTARILCGDMHSAVPCGLPPRAVLFQIQSGLLRSDQ